MQLVEASRGGDGGATKATDEDAEDVIGKKREGVVEELIAGASVGDENMARQESGVVGGVGSLSITLQLQLQEHRLPVGHCQWRGGEGDGGGSWERPGVLPWPAG